MTARSPRACLLLGASSQLGVCVLPHLLAAHFRVHAVSRQKSVEFTTESHKLENLHWHVVDLNTVHAWPAEVSMVVHLAPLYVLPRLLRHASAALRVIAISSTSVRTKQDSPSKAERRMAQRLWQAEQDLQQLCKERGHNLTILRPTMLYGLGRDATIGRMQAFVRRWRFLPIPAAASGLRQPVHVEDIAAAILQVLDEPRCVGMVYELGGAQRLTVQQLAQRICLDNDLTVRIFRIPVSILSMLLSVLTFIRPGLDWSPALLKRAALDQIADNQAAIDDFQYAPRTFDGTFYPLQKRD